MLLLEKLRSKDKLDWSRAVIDSSHVRAARRGPKAGPGGSIALPFAIVGYAKNAPPAPERAAKTSASLTGMPSAASM